MSLPPPHLPQKNQDHHADGWLLDLYPQAADMILWFILDDGRRLRLRDPFTPIFYVSFEGQPDPEQSRRALRAALARLDGLEPAGPARRLDFWSGDQIDVEAIRVTNLDLAGPNLRALARQLPELTCYNCDIAPEIHYAYDRGLFPTARCRLTWRGDTLTACELLDRADDTRYDLPPLREAQLTARGNLLGRRPRLLSLSLACEGRTLTWDDAPPAEMLRSLRDALRACDPDLLWTEGGDAALLPALLTLAQRHRAQLGPDADLALDREPGIRRRLRTDGHTFVSYGQVLYQAPDYPLFGRWHIDRHNSFWAGTIGLAGLVEVARLARLPVQRAARRSIGTGISSIQLHHAFRQGYLIPWKKCRPEAWKSAATLLKSDRGGLVYQPLVGVYEDVIELDFVSMYPTIMVRCNVSPETINCPCCKPQPDVPELGYTICRRRRGLVSAALEPIIARRALFKSEMKRLRAAADPAAADLFRQRQEALKWLLVCCFGYLGYRNARFGRIEAHETTTAFSRDKLLRAREICEDRGFRVLHAIVDCVWIQREGATDAEIADLCREINAATDLTIALEGRYRWLAFLPSRMNPDMPVPNRYFGLFEDGTLKYRGIEVRRSDQAPYVQRVQRELLDALAAAPSLAACRALRGRLYRIVQEAERRLRERAVDLEDLIFKRKTSMEADDYRGNGMTALAARQMKQAGLTLHAGEVVRYLVLSEGDRDLNARIRVPSLLGPDDAFDVEFYVNQLRRAAATLLEPILAEPLPPL